MLLVSCLQEQIAKVKGMQTRLRSYYKLNGRYFWRNYVSKTDLNHTVRMVFGMANEMSEKELTFCIQRPPVVGQRAALLRAGGVAADTLRRVGGS
ncbi:MAG: hypothetical protein IJV25_01670 [Prevotella sp.]|nr:hypothetical protein [Prevotella sp.]